MAPGTAGKDKPSSTLPAQGEEEGKPKERGPLWVYGINAHLGSLELPVGFAPTGNIRADYMSLCGAVGAVPHPAFKPKPVQPVKRKESSSRKPSKAHFVDSEPEPPKEETCFSVRSFLVDNPSMRLFSLLLPSATTLKVVVFSECSLDMEMLSLLRAGLVASTSIESLQVEWNPLELPLPSLEEVEAQSQKSAEADSEDALSPLQMSWRGGGETDLLELRERRRYLLQSQRSLSSFKAWLTTHFGGNLGDAWKSLDVDGDSGKLLTKMDFHDQVEARIGLSGQHVLEVFDLLDGPDYAGGEGKLSLLALKEAMEQLPALVIPEGQQDPIGATLSTFLEGAHLESVSFRACAIAWPELQTMCSVLTAKPWQLRCLNLWDNRICDYGAELLARAMEEYRGLEYLGLGRNRITDTGFEALCRPFNQVIVTESGLKAAQERVKQQQDHLTQLTKAKAKAKPDPSKKAPAANQTSRHTREPVYFVSTLEEVKSEVEGASASWILKRGCELKSMNVAENPIRIAEVVEAMHSRGPAGVELVLRGTPAAERLLKAGGKVMEQRRPNMASGWLLRLT